MKQIIVALAAVVTLTQCSKTDPGEDILPVKPVLLDFKVDPNYFVDTIKFGYPGSMQGGYVFHYDNLNRVTDIKFYEYFFNTPVYNDRTCTFFYNGSNMLPNSLHLYTHESGAPESDSFRIHFTYNAENLKIKDSIIDLKTPSEVGIRNYFYDPAFRYVKSVYRLKGDTVTTYRDSVRIKNFNCDSMSSIRRVWLMPGYQVENRNISSYCSKFDDKINPLSKLNIFPALFLSNFATHTYRPPLNMTVHDFFMDFTTTNNILYLQKNIPYFGSGPLKQISGYEKYDSKNRILEKPYKDSSGNSSLGIYFVKYDYHY